MTTIDWNNEEEFNKQIEAFSRNAGALHNSVNQKYDMHPYSYHLNMVADKTKENIRKYYGDKLDRQTVGAIMFGAYYHDSIEDARLTYNDVMRVAKMSFDEENAKIATEIVYALSNEKGRNRSERANDKYYEGIRNTPYASIVKLSDREANMEYSKESGSRMYDVYLSEHDHFIKSIGICEKKATGSTTFFTSDLHFCHDKEFVWKDRGFKSVDEMNEAIILNWNRVVDEDDVVYVLGDIALGGNEGTSKAKGLLECLNGEIRIIIGNHDTDKRIEEYKKAGNVSSAKFADRIKLKGRSFFLSHYPAETSNLEADPKACVINLHGHTHHKEKFLYEKPYMYNVGLDAHGMAPVSIDEIIDDFNKKVDDCVKCC